MVHVLTVLARNMAISVRIKAETKKRISGIMVFNAQIEELAFAFPFDMMYSGFYGHAMSYGVKRVRILSFKNNSKQRSNV
jgi:hypothetical protein